MLGELYKPSGLARETAIAVLEVEEPYASCSYCYVPKFTHKPKDERVKVRHPVLPPVKLVEHQFIKLNMALGSLDAFPVGVLLSFLTRKQCRAKAPDFSRGVSEA